MFVVILLMQVFLLSSLEDVLLSPRCLVFSLPSVKMFGTRKFRLLDFLNIIVNARTQITLLIAFFDVIYTMNGCNDSKVLARSSSPNATIHTYGWRGWVGVAGRLGEEGEVEQGGREERRRRRRRKGEERRSLLRLLFLGGGGGEALASSSPLEEREG